MNLKITALKEPENKKISFFTAYAFYTVKISFRNEIPVLSCVG